MKRRVADFLVCPVSQSPLQVIAWESESVTLSKEHYAKALDLQVTPESFSEEIVTGVLVNSTERLLYPIVNGIPRLLTFRTEIAQRFVEQNRARLEREFPGHSLPDEQSPPGEKEVLRTFSSEWLDYDWDGKAYWNLDPEHWFRCMRYILRLDDCPVRRSLVLELGIGIGGVANYVAEADGCEVVGVDLGYSVDGAYRHFRENPFFHIIQASAFAMPFPTATFDFIYSFGVLHHTYNTKCAFDSVARCVKLGGRLFVWVYSYYDEERSLVRRLLMLSEKIVRPLVSPLGKTAQSIALAPFIPCYMLHQAIRSLFMGGVRYGWREAMHAARDRFTPRYVHRHTDAEVVKWFGEAGYEDMVCASQRQRPDYVPIGFTACTGVDGVRRRFKST